MSALLRLSLVRVTRSRVPAPLTNEDRVRAFRAYAPPVMGNGHDWQHRRRREYALEAAADSAPSTDDYQEEL